MKPASFSFARTVILSAAMLLPAAASSLAEEFVNTGAAPPSRYEVTPDRPAAAGMPYGYVDRQAARYANPSNAYAEYGFMRFEYPCQLSPASLESSACNSE